MVANLRPFSISSNRQHAPTRLPRFTPHRLVQVSVRLQPHPGLGLGGVNEGGKTRLTATVHYPSLEVRDMVLASGMARGAGISYDRLEDLVAELQRSCTASSLEDS